MSAAAAAAPAKDTSADDRFDDEDTSASESGDESQPEATSTTTVPAETDADDSSVSSVDSRSDASGSDADSLMGDDTDTGQASEKTATTFEAPSGPDVPCTTCGNQAAIERLDTAGRAVGATCVVCPYSARLGVSDEQVNPYAGRFLEGLLTLQILRKDSLATTRKALFKQLSRQGGAARVDQFNQMARKLKKVANEGMPRVRRLTAWLPTRRMNRQMINTALLSLLEKQEDVAVFARQVIDFMALAFDSRPGVMTSEARYRSRAMFKAIVNEFGVAGDVPHLISFVGKELARVAPEDVTSAAAAAATAGSESGSESGSEAGSDSDSEGVFSSADERDGVEMVGALRLGRRRFFKGYSTSEMARSMTAFLAGAERRLASDPADDIPSQLPEFGRQVAAKFSEYRAVIAQQRQQEMFVDFVVFLSENFSPSYARSLSKWKKLSSRATGALKKQLGSKKKTTAERNLRFRANKRFENVNYRKVAETLWGMYSHYAKVPKLRTQVRTEIRERSDVRKDIQSVYKSVLKQYTQAVELAYATWAVNDMFVRMFNELLMMFSARPLPLVPVEVLDAASETSAGGDE